MHVDWVRRQRRLNLLIGIYDDSYMNGLGGAPSVLPQPLAGCSGEAGLCVSTLPMVVEMGRDTSLPPLPVGPGDDAFARKLAPAGRASE